MTRPVVCKVSDAVEVFNIVSDFAARDRSKGKSAMLHPQPQRLQSSHAAVMVSKSNRHRLGFGHWQCCVPRSFVLISCTNMGSLYNAFSHWSTRFTSHINVSRISK